MCLYVVRMLCASCLLLYLIYILDTRQASTSSSPPRDAIIILQFRVPHEPPCFSFAKDPFLSIGSASSYVRFCAPPSTHHTLHLLQLNVVFRAVCKHREVDARICRFLIGGYTGFLSLGSKESGGRVCLAIQNPRAHWALEQGRG